jgi:hydrogenase maturation protein HypF
MNRTRARILISGAVQGVGFRPFVYRLATELELVGWVSNSAQGVVIEIEGAESKLSEFSARLQIERPRLAVIQSIQSSVIAPVHETNFEVRVSERNGSTTAVILPDIATCSDCLSELFDPNDRRYLYPFTNCTHCGPRFSIIEALPYDRANTSMKRFAMCAACEEEYQDPGDRRFHAQPNACPECGPQLELWDGHGGTLSKKHDALLQGASMIRTGQIVAVKGIGGFQLIVDASNESAVQRLRSRKRREEKPFAVIFPNFSAIHDCCCVGPLEHELLQSPASPIVLLKKSTQSRVVPSVAPRNPYLGAMLPYSPLHHLLLTTLRFPLVATSGNVSDEPICIDEREALERLRGIADAFLVNNRPIVRHVDDSVVRVMAGRKLILRRARGYAPLPVDLAKLRSHNSVLALGAHLKNAIGLKVENQGFISQHIGDLQTSEAFAAFKSSAADLPRLYRSSPAIIAHDLHPEYLSSKYAQQLASIHPGARGVGVQHHYAHVLSCLAENGLSGSCLGVAWDGAGFGTDGTIWGGEFLLINETSFERFAHFRRFRLAGGDWAAKQPCRSAISLLYEIFGAAVFEQHDLRSPRSFSPSELRTLKQMLERGINSPLTSSAGRFFDAIASLIGLRQRANFEGQAAMELEFAAADGIDAVYSVKLSKTKPAVFNWQPMIIELLNDIRQSESTALIAAKAHNTLVALIVAVAHEARELNVVLSGGCFQNRYLLERAVSRLREEGFIPHWHRLVPPNDGGIALGQIMAALRSPVAPSALGSEPDGRQDELAAELPTPVSQHELV